MRDATKIAVVLDRSGSMAEIRDATIAGFNEFLKAQKALPGDASILLSQFDNEYKVDYDKPLAEAPELNTERYVPRGSTALLDAIGRTINEVGAKLAAMAEAERPSKVIFVIITDGQENASREFRREKIFEMVTHQREVYKWQFMFLAANMDAITEGAKLGVTAGASMNYAAQPLAAKAMFRASSNRAGAFRSFDSPVEFSEQERNAAMAPDPPETKTTGA